MVVAVAAAGLSNCTTLSGAEPEIGEIVRALVAVDAVAASSACDAYVPCAVGSANTHDVAEAVVNCTGTPFSHV